MKILTLVFSIGTGGTERAAVNYAIAYRLAGHDSRVLVAGEGHDRKEELAEAGVPTILLSQAGGEREKVLQSLKHWSPDIMHLHNYNDAYLPFIRLLKAGHTKVVETNVFSRPQLRAGYRQIDLSLQLSRWGLWKYDRWMRGAPWKPQQAVVPYIILSKRFRPPHQDEIQAFRTRLGIPANAFVAGRLGQSHPSKWDRRLLNIVSKTVRKDNNIWYFLVGLPGSIRKELENFPTWQKSRVVLLDAIKGDPMLALYYHSLQCMVHLSAIGESFGYVLAEALCCRVPVITLLTPFRDNAQYEVVGPLKGGFCCTNIDECIKAVFQLYHSPGAREEIRNRLPEWVDDRFGPKTVISHVEEQYRKLLSEETIETPESDSLIKQVLKLYGWKSSLMYIIMQFYHHPFFYRLLGIVRRSGT